MNGASTTGALIGMCACSGLMLMVSGWWRSRRPSIDQRILPYLRDVHASAQSEAHVGVGLGALGAAARRAIERLGRAVGELLGGHASVARRLARLAEERSVEDFRVEQLAWGGAGLAFSLMGSVVLVQRGATVGPSLAVLCLVGAVVGVQACDQRLSARVTSRERQLTEELPVVAEMLALAVAAGESPMGALDRITRVCHGALSDEITAVVAQVRTGTPIVVAFDALAARTGVPAVARFAAGLAVAVERGTPLADVLHAQAADVREAHRRHLMEQGGRKEVLMMVPVVFMVLPITVLFAFFPGLVGLSLSSGM